MTFACSYCTFATQEYFTTHTYHELMESNITTLYSVMVVPKKIKTRAIITLKHKTRVFFYFSLGILCITSYICTITECWLIF